MDSVEIVICIQESLFDRVIDLAEELQIPETQLFALAIEEYVKRHKNRIILETLNAAYDGTLDPDEEALREGMRRRQRKLVEE